MAAVPRTDVTAAGVLAALPAARGCAVVRDGGATVVAVAPDEVRIARGADAFALLDAAAEGGFWTGALAYELGHAIERVRPRPAGGASGVGAAAGARGARPSLPDVVLARYSARLVLRPGREPEIVGDGPAVPVLERAVWRARAGDRPTDGLAAGPASIGAPWVSSHDRAAHARAVRAVLELLRAGDCYQVNVTRRLESAAAADPVALYTAIDDEHPAPHAALLTFGPSGPDLAIVSASPELFLRVDGRSVVTRPVKGTARDARRLATSGKDRAENVMIVDLARNDLGRVCEFGSVTVDDLCGLESHPGLHHLVSTVRGRLRADVAFADLVRATFPPASVTGAPKPRVMQAIEDLEPVPRGVYCGAVGWIDGDADRAELAVAIRTFTIAGGTTSYGAGGGIVADSLPAAEWAETETKSARLLAIASRAPLPRAPVTPLGQVAP